MNSSQFTALSEILNLLQDRCINHDADSKIEGLNDYKNEQKVWNSINYLVKDPRTQNKLKKY